MKGLTIAACLMLGGFVAARALLVPLTYDEAASYLRYISQDFLAVFNFEVATNHFLNTLPTKLVSIIAGDSELALRLPSLAGYGLYLSFSVLILRSISERPVAIAGFVLLNLNPYLLDYFALSRGYGLSLGCLMGALFFFLRFASRRVSGESGNTDAGRALMFGCAAVLAGFSLLDAYLGIFAVMVVMAWTTRAAAHQGAEKSRFAGLFLFTTAALFTFLVLSQDHRLTERLYEPVTIGFAGLDQSELDAITVSRINLRQRPEAVARLAGGSVWRVDSVATRGLRVEMPATAAAKIRDGRALVETIVGSRPFVQRGGEGDVWSLRDTGDTVVFENGPALSLQRSRMGLYKPVINWRGDSRHLGWVAAYTTAAMALLGGLAMLLTTAGWAAGRLRVLTAGEWRPMMFGLLWVAALAGPPLYLLRRGEELYFGGMRGFVEDTIYSLIESSFYGRTYFTSQAEFVFGAIGVTIAAFGIVAYLGWRRHDRPASTRGLDAGRPRRGVSRRDPSELVARHAVSPRPHRAVLHPGLCAVRDFPGRCDDACGQSGEDSDSVPLGRRRRARRRPLRRNGQRVTHLGLEKGRGDESHDRRPRMAPQRRARGRIPRRAGRRAELQRGRGVLRAAMPLGDD